MTLFRVEITKQLGTEKWTNVYHTSAADLDDAVTNAVGIENWEKSVTKNTVSFIHRRVSEVGTHGTNFKSIIATGTGDVTPDGDSTPLPLWNVVKINFQPANNGRYDAKYLRIPLYSNEVDADFKLTSTFKTFVGNNYANGQIGSSAVCSDDGSQYTSFGVESFVKDRDLNRRKKKAVIVP